MMLSRVTPGRMMPVSNGGVNSSFSPCSFFQYTNRFMAPTSVHSSCSPYNHNTCWQPCSSAALADT